MRKGRQRTHRVKRIPRAGHSSHPRAGFTLFELAISAILLATVLVSTVPALSWILRVRQSAERRQAATLEVGNLMEQVAALPWEQITPERLAAFHLTGELARQLPSAELNVMVSVPAADPDARQVFIELSWNESLGETPHTSVRLAAWIYRNVKGTT